MKRRDFLTSACTAALGLSLDGITLDRTPAVAQSVPPATFDHTPPAYVVLGVPLRAGSLYPGTENDAQAYRDADLIRHLNNAGCRAVDAGDLAIPSFLPHHSVPPIRNWPSPRIVWDILNEKLTPLLKQTGQVPLLIGCDCSVVVGTAQALRNATSSDIQIIYIDGDCDDSAPISTRSQSAASCAVWFLTNNSPFWNGPELKPAQVSLVGWSRSSQSKEHGPTSIPLTEVRRIGTHHAALQILAAVPRSSAILIHLDIDVFRSSDLTAIYFPHEEGLSLEEGTELIGTLLKDPRVRLIEISEYASLRDVDQSSVRKLIQLLADNLPKVPSPTG
jgi:arginase family enzyme